MLWNRAVYLYDIVSKRKDIFLTRGKTLDLHCLRVYWFYSQKLMLTLTKLKSKRHFQSMFRKLTIHALTLKPFQMDILSHYSTMSGSNYKWHKKSELSIHFYQPPSQPYYFVRGNLIQPCDNILWGHHLSTFPHEKLTASYKMKPN